MKKRYPLVVALLISACPLCNFSQVFAANLTPFDPGSVQQRSLETMEYYRLQKKVKKSAEEKIEDEKLIEKPEEPKEAAPAKIERKIFIRQLDFGESEILTLEELQEITRDYEGREITIEDLFAAVERINQLYKSKKIYLAKAILPAQEVKDGIVKIKLIEGRIGDIRLENNQYTKSDFISNRIDVTPGELIDLKRLENEIVRFNRIWDVQVRAVLKPGEEVGTSNYNLIAEEAAQYELMAFLDNAGSKSTGEERFGAFFKDASLFGYRDQFTIGAVAADGTESGSFLYSVPVWLKGTRLAGSYNFNQIKVKSGPFESLDINGDSSDVGGSISHPFIFGPRKKLTVFGEYHRKKSTTEYAGIINAEVISRDTSLGADFEFSTDYGFWRTRHTVTHGRDNDHEDLEFYKYNADLVWIQRFKEKLTSVVKVSGQIADSDLLPAFDQFQLGGMSSVRGYTEGALSGDDGYFVSGELNVPLNFSAETWDYLNDKVSGFAFLDHGGAFPFKADGASINHDDYLTSVGCGLDFFFSKWFSGRLHFAVPLGDREPDQADVRVHFYLQSNILN